MPLDISPVSPKSRRVLVVEDKAADVARLKEMIDWSPPTSKFGFELVRSVARLEEALDCIAAEEVDLVLLDLTLPGCGGIEAFVNLHTASPYLPVIILSDLDDELTALRIVQEGAQDYLIKGELTARTLRRAMRYAMERERAERAVKEMEEALSRERNLLRSTIDNVPDFIHAKDSSGRYLLSNHAHARLLKANLPQELLGKSVFDFFPYALATRYQADDQEVVTSGKPIIDKVEPTLDLDGSARWISTTKAPLADSGGKIVGVVTIARDITVQKQAQEELLQANVDLSRSREELMKAMQELRSVHLQLIEAEKMKLVGRLAAGVAHEVKNPLAVVEMGMDYMRHQEFDDPNIKVIIREITDAVKRADNVVRGLLDFSAPKSLAMEPGDLNALIRHALMLARGEFKGGKIQVVEEMEATLPLVRSDRMKMEQVFVNLFTNAAHAMEGGGKLVVRTSSRQLTGLGENVSNFGTFQLGDQLVVAEVLDTGHGLPEASEGKLFEPFYTTKPTGKGTGLGLTVTKSIIDLHGGTIGIRNRPEGGVCATIVLRAEQTYEKDSNR